MTENKYQDDLTAIRSMMERSSRFISLSGMSGIAAGVIALLGAVFTFYLFHQQGSDYLSAERDVYSPEFLNQLIITAIVILGISLGAGIYFTMRKSRRMGLKVWTNTTKYLLINLCVPLVAGGLFCLALIHHGLFALLAPATLVFYGLALINASKYTYTEIYYLGLIELLLGIIACFWLGYGLIFWTVGFGLLHIIYGFLMYRKYP